MEMQSGQFLGYVQVRVGSQVHALAVQAVPFERDSDAAPGGLFEEKDGKLGIWVASDASDAEKTAQIKRASMEAAERLSRKFLN